MAVEQVARRQLACKMVDLRSLRPGIAIERRQRPAPADEVDTREQTRKIKDWIPKKNSADRLGDKLKTYAREVEILNTISHVSAIKRFIPYLTSCSLTSSTSRKSLPQRIHCTQFYSILTED
jgi:hypothetical protein